MLFVLQEHNTGFRPQLCVLTNFYVCYHAHVRLGKVRFKMCPAGLNHLKPPAVARNRKKHVKMQRNMIKSNMYVRPRSSKLFLKVHGNTCTDILILSLILFKMLIQGSDITPEAALTKLSYILGKVKILLSILCTFLSIVVKVIYDSLCTICRYIFDLCI